MDLKISKIQKNFKGKCPECKGRLHEVEDEVEMYLYCDNCLVSIDTSGGIIQ
jgi:reverse gyrase